MQQAQSVMSRLHSSLTWCDLLLIPLSLSPFFFLFLSFSHLHSSAKLLEPLTKQKAVKVEIMKRPKDEEGGKKVFEEFAEKIASAVSFKSLELDLTRKRPSLSS